MYIDIDGRVFPAFYGIQRPDVSKKLNNDKYLYSGFERAIPFKIIGKGQHKLSLKVLTNDKKGYYQLKKSFTFSL